METLGFKQDKLNFKDKWGKKLFIAVLMQVAHRIYLTTLNITIN